MLHSQWSENEERWVQARPRGPEAGSFQLLHRCCEAVINGLEPGISHHNRENKQILIITVDLVWLKLQELIYIAQGEAVDQ